MMDQSKEVEGLEKRVRQLVQDQASLLEKYARVMEENARLKAQVLEFQRRLAMDSTNSSQPPSRDGYQKKAIKPAIAKQGKANGGQPGHRGRTLERVAMADQVQVHRPESCGSCGRVFTCEDSYEVVSCRQVFDLPEPKLEVKEHQLVEVRCSCGCVQSGQFPPQVTARVQYGSTVRALVTKLSVDHRMPLGQISRLFEDLYGYEINSTTIEQTLRRGHDLAESVQAHIKTHLNNAPCVHLDESGVRVAGQLHWLHVASTDRWTHLFVHEKRGQAALDDEASILGDYRGTAVHDCWGPYFAFDQLEHRLCGAHLLRELQGVIEYPSSPQAIWAEAMHGFLLDLYQTTCSGPDPTPIQDPVAQDQVRQVFRKILEQADQQEPPPRPGKRGRPKRSKGRNLFERLQRYEDGVLGFAFEAQTPFTNNQAERDLRPAKVKQKVSGCFRTLEGARVFAQLQALLSTLRKQQRPIFSSLCDLFSGIDPTFN